jgi:hypothetical protein
MLNQLLMVLERKEGKEGKEGKEECIYQIHPRAVH